LHGFRLLDLLRGRTSGPLLSMFRRLNTNKSSRIIITIAAHGGENFIKIRGKAVILSDELNRALWEMHIKERYKEILFILDTCEGFTLFDYVDVPNVYFVTSSIKDQKATSHSHDPYYMTPTIDKFHFKVHETIDRIKKSSNFNYNIHDMFSILQKDKFFQTDIAIKNTIQREILFEEFFGNYLRQNEIMEGRKLSLDQWKEFSLSNGLFLNDKQIVKNDKIVDKVDYGIKQNVQNYSETVSSSLDIKDIVVPWNIAVKILGVFFFLNVVYIVLTQ
jgi:glycosylphosphatidylinositol transamidase (GPIT) subunit GPI8